jgi:hypothetical protein
VVDGVEVGGKDVLLWGWFQVVEPLKRRVLKRDEVGLKNGWVQNIPRSSPSKNLYGQVVHVTNSFRRARATLHFNSSFSIVSVATTTSLLSGSVEQLQQVKIQ